MIWLKRISVFILIFVFLFVLSGFFITHFYGKELTRYIISEISRNLNAEIEIGEVENLSVFKKFPFASIALNNALLKEILKNNEEKDTLFFAKKIYLQFNIIDVFQSDYKIKRIAVSGGFLRMKVDKNGNENYIIKSTSRQQENESYLVKLSRLRFSGFDFFYKNKVNEHEYKIHCNEGVLKGNFSNEKFLLGIEGDFFSYYFKTEDVGFFQERKITLKTELDIDRTRKIFSVNMGEITIDEKMDFALSGKIREEKIVELTLKSQNLDIPSALELLPLKYKETFSDYQSKGIIHFECTINGELNNEKTPAIAAVFGIEDGTLQQKNTAYSVDKIFLKGCFSNGKNKNPSTSMIEINEFKGNLGSGSISGKIAVKNLNAPKIKLSAEAQFSLDDLKKFIALDSIESISGTIAANINYEGALKSSEDFFAKDFQNAKSSGDIHFENVSFSLKESPLEYRNFSGELLLRNNDILVRQFKGNVSSSDFEVSGICRNALAYLFLPQEKLTVEAEFTSTNLNLNELLSENENKRDTLYLLVFPERINFNLNAKMDRLFFRKFNASDAEGIFTMQNNILRSENIFFKTMNGNVSGNFEIDASDKDAIILSSYNKISDIDIHRLFRDFENFGQGIITEKHMKGEVTAEMQFVMMVDSALNADESRIYALADLTIENGELIGFEPMNDISGYIKNHVFLKRIIKTDEFEKKLKYIRFSALKNQIEIKERKIIIPVMNIHSSAMNIEAEGTHSFDNIIDYKINFFLSELLTKKEEVSQDEFGEIEDDGTGKKKIFMTIKGTIDNPEISYDKKKVKKNIQKEAQKEKQIVKSVLKEEFGWFKKDSLSSVKKETQDDFMIEWEVKQSEVDSAKVGQSAKNKTETKEKKLKHIFDKLNTEEKKKYDDFEFEKTDDF